MTAKKTPTPKNARTIKTSKHRAVIEEVLKKVKAGPKAKGGFSFDDAAVEIAEKTKEIYHVDTLRKHRRKEMDGSNIARDALKAAGAKIDLYAEASFLYEFNKERLLEYREEEMQAATSAKSEARGAVHSVLGHTSNQFEVLKQTAFELGVDKKVAEGSSAQNAFSELFLRGIVGAQRQAMEEAASKVVAATDGNPAS